MTDFDLEEQLEPEQFTEDSDDRPSKEVYKQLREQKRREAYYEKHNKAVQQKHKARFTRQNNLNHYICDRCGEVFEEGKGSLMYKSEGEFAYCAACTKELYPNYKPIRLFGTKSKSDFMSNHYDTKYFKGF